MMALSANSSEQIGLHVLSRTVAFQRANSGFQKKGSRLFLKRKRQKKEENGQKTEENGRQQGKKGEKKKFRRPLLRNPDKRATASVQNRFVLFFSFSFVFYSVKGAQAGCIVEGEALKKFFFFRRFLGGSDFPTCACSLGIPVWDPLNWVS